MCTPKTVSDGTLDRLSSSDSLLSKHIDRMAPIKTASNTSNRFGIRNRRGRLLRLLNGESQSGESQIEKLTMRADESVSRHHENSLQSKRTDSGPPEHNGLH